MARFQVETFFSTGDTLVELKQQINQFLVENDHKIKNIIELKYSMQEDEHDFYFSAILLYRQKRKVFFSTSILRN